MGLDVSHDCWHGAYSAFMRWREGIAKAASIPLWAMDGYYEAPPDGPMDWARARDGGPECGSYNGPTLHRWIEKIAATLPLPWSLYDQRDPICIILNHSDCEGSIDAGDCALLAARMEELLPALDAMGDGGGHVGGYGDKTRTFIAGLRAAAAAGEDVEFH
jgi:hypothetical protein